MFFLSFFAVFVSFCFTGILGDLEAFETSARFPTQRKSVITAYDGDDLIYIFGGERTRQDGDIPLPLEIIKYNISADIMEVVGHLPEVRWGGTAVFDGNGDIILIAGQAFYQTAKVYKFNPNKLELSVVWEDPAGWIGAVRGQLFNETHLLLCEARSSEANIFWYDIESNVTTNLGHVDMYQREYYDCVYHQESGILYVFGTLKIFGFCPEPHGPSCSVEIVAKYNIETGTVEEIKNGQLLGLENEPSVIWDGRYFYIVGGKLYWDLPLDDILRFDPETEEHERVHVNNFPTMPGERGFGFTEAVYVSKLRRIYLVAGGTFPVGTEKIWYIQLE